MIEHLPQYVASVLLAAYVLWRVDWRTVRVRRRRRWRVPLSSLLSPSLRAAANARTFDAPASLEEALLQFAVELRCCDWLKTGAECPRCDRAARDLAELVRANL